MRIVYSPDERLLYVRLQAGKVEETIEVGREVYADLDASGEPLGIEALDPGEFFAFIAARAPTTDGRAVVDLPEGLARLVRTARATPAATSIASDEPRSISGPRDLHLEPRALAH